MFLTNVLFRNLLFNFIHLEAFSDVLLISILTQLQSESILSEKIWEMGPEDARILSVKQGEQKEPFKQRKQLLGEPENKAFVAMTSS